MTIEVCESLVQLHKKLERRKARNAEVDCPDCDGSKYAMLCLRCDGSGTVPRWTIEEGETDGN